jgi:GNAT superfamily N-acetyltransferase
VDYGPPRGEALLACLDGEPVGILMMRDLGDGICEMNRMFVLPRARGRGVARALSERLIDAAREKGHREMRLTAWERHEEALGLYRSIGFVPNNAGQLDGASASAVKMSLNLAR